MTWDNSLFDAAFDAVGLRDTVTLLKGSVPYPTFQARFDRPQHIMLDDQVHTTDYSIEYTTGDIQALSSGDRVQILGATYEVKQPPVAQGDGHWTIAALELP